MAIERIKGVKLSMPASLAFRDIAVEEPLCRPPPVWEPEMIPGGHAAPELGMHPVDYVPIDHADLTVRGAPSWGQLKGDGFRAHYIGSRIVTRNGVPLNCALHTWPGLRRLEDEFGVPMFFDGEYIEEEGFDATISAMRRGQGCGVFWIFDALPLLEWQTDSCPRPIEERLALLEQLVPRAQSPFVGMLKPFPLCTHEDALAQFGALTRLGWEGIVIKRARSLYRRRRSPDWQRWKETIAVDCSVIDVLTRDGLLKALMVRGPEGVPIKVDRGWSEREALFILKSCGIRGSGRPLVVEIAYNRKAGEAKARHARFRRLRPDK